MLFIQLFSGADWPQGGRSICFPNAGNAGELASPIIWFPGRKRQLALPEKGTGQEREQGTEIPFFDGMAGAVRPCKTTFHGQIEKIVVMRVMSVVSDWTLARKSGIKGA